MEENKKCCEGKECESGNCSMHCMMHKCGSWDKCPMMKHAIWFIILLIVFCLGAQFGELKSEARGGHEFRGEMMNWNYKNVKPLTETIPSAPTTPSNPAPTVTQ